MKIKVNGIKRDVIIMQAPQGSYCSDEDGYELRFPIYIGLCEPITREEERQGNVLVLPVYGDCNFGCEGTEPQYIMNDVSLYDLQKLIVNYTREYICDLKDAVEEIMDLFEIHKTPIPLPVRKYVDDVMNGTITKIPTNG